MGTGSRERRRRTYSPYISFSGNSVSYLILLLPKLLQFSPLLKRAKPSGTRYITHGHEGGIYIPPLTTDLFSSIKNPIMLDLSQTYEMLGSFIFQVEEFTLGMSCDLNKFSKFQKRIDLNFRNHTYLKCIKNRKKVQYNYCTNSQRSWNF